MKFAYLTLAATVAFAFAAVDADAANYTFSLTGNVADFTSGSIDFSDFHFDNHYLDLSGLDASNAVTVVQGDTINTTVTLDQAYTIPVSSYRTDFLQFFQGSSFPAGNTQVTGNFTFFDGGNIVKTGAYTSSTSGQLASFAAFFPPDNAAFTFDSFTNVFAIDTLGAPALLDHASLQYSLVSSNTVPEPATWAMMIAGFGLVGGVMRAARRPSVAFSAAL